MNARASSKSRSRVSSILLLLALAATSQGDVQAPASTLATGGPSTAPGSTGPARFVGRLFDAFDVQRAMEIATFADGFYRAPANDGYEATLDEIARRLRVAGFGEDERLTLRFLETEQRVPSWTPLRARLELLMEGEEPVLLHGFDTPGGADRVMLPVNAPGGSAVGPVAFSLDEVSAGAILVTSEGLARRSLQRAKEAGALAVLSSAVFEFTVDPSGADRHRDAIQFQTLPPDPPLLVGRISPRSHDRLRELHDLGRAPRLSFEAEVRFTPRMLRTLIAEVVGAERPVEAVAIASHVQEPGAGDNASGLAGITESAIDLAQLVRAHELGWPMRTISFIWGNEYEQSRIWLDHTEREAIAAISADMLGQATRTGAIALLERTPDPGAVVTLPPDAHTAWGAGRVTKQDVKPNGLAVIARTALHDVAARVGGWKTSENPWEGGSDHDVFMRRDVPAVLLWHFTDFTYHTGLDRMEMQDGEELRRTCVAVMATALAVADARSDDLERHLASLELERELRVQAARDAKREDVAADWNTWSVGAAEWLRALCAPDKH